MLPYETALELVLAQAPVLGSEQVELDGALFRVLAEDIATTDPLPRDDTSAMDGYAVCVQDFANDGPWRFKVVGESRAGGATEQVVQGCACRIFTGAVLPKGADAVVLQEDATRFDDEVEFRVAPACGANIRRRGEDLAGGSLVLRTGTRITPFVAGLLAAVERPVVRVFRAPRLGVICTGSELRASGTPGPRGTIAESNSIAILGLARQAGARTLRPRLVKDDLDATRRHISELLEDADVLVTVGGVSVGDHDVVKEALQQSGVQLEFWKVRIKPGKPLVYGRFGDKVVLGLPGNPVSAQVTFCLFGLPLLRCMQGHQHPKPQLRSLTLTQPLRQTPGRRGFHRVTVSTDRATPLDSQSSGSVASMALSDGLAMMHEDLAILPEGSGVDVLCFADL